VAAHNLKNPFQATHNPSRELVGMVFLLLSCTHGIVSIGSTSKDEEDIKTLRELGEE
jgi:hypothetical protein